MKKKGDSTVSKKPVSKGKIKGNASKVAVKRNVPSAKSSRTSPVAHSKMQQRTPVTGKNKKKEEKPKTSHKKAIRVILIFFIIGILVCGIYLMLTLPYFNVTKLFVEGTEKYLPEEVIQKSGIQVGKNVFIQLFHRGQADAFSLPYIEKLQLSYLFPNEIKIKVKERTSTYFAFDKEKNKFFRLSEDGYILEEVDIQKKSKDELLTYGITFDNEVQLGTRINDIDLSKIGIYEKVAEEFSKSGIKGSITKVNFENSLTTITLDDKLNIVLPNDTDLSYNMSFLKGIIEKLGEGSVGVIDMTKDNPTFSTF